MHTTWQVTCHGGQGWQVEFPAAGIEQLNVLLLPNLRAAMITDVRALASSYDWCEVMQVAVLLLLLVSPQRL